MTMNPALRRLIALSLALFALGATTAPGAFANKKAVVGPVSFDVPDDFTAVAGPPPSLHEDASGVTLDVSELPPQAFQEFKGDTFLEFLKSLGYTNPAYADGALKRSDAYTYVLADAKGEQGPEQRFLLVLGGTGHAAIVTASVPKSQIATGKANRAAIETILTAASLVPAATPPPPAAKP